METADTYRVRVVTDHLPFFIYVLVVTLIAVGFAIGRVAYRNRQTRANAELSERIARKRLEEWSDSHFPGVENEPLS